MASNSSDSVGFRSEPVSPRSVVVAGEFWGPRIQTTRSVTVPYVLDKCEETGRTGSLKLEWKPGDEPRPHHFWDSDIAKSIEAVAYSLMVEPNKDLENRVDALVELLAAAQQPDGYLNSYFLQVEPENTWTNLRDAHELYCAGHLIEAAVAYYDATGKDRLLQIVERYAELILGRYGPGKTPGYPGHEEIELALAKLYRTTGKPEYLELAKLFIDRRGTEPNFFKDEAVDRGEAKPWRWPPFEPNSRDAEVFQAHRPVREQKKAVGHSVRAGYLYSGMADVAALTDDGELLEACKRLWRNLVDCRMYVTGGIGSHTFGERFSYDYDLPNEEAYAESCAAISLAFFAQRMLNIEPCREYGDVLERVVYNGLLSGIALDGTHFFYANPLASHPVATRMPQARLDPSRREWYGCACCPPNLARFLASLGSFAYSSAESEVWVHLFVEGRAEIEVNGTTVYLSVATRYPWDGEIRIEFETAVPVNMNLNVRIPGWCDRPVVEIDAGDDATGAIDPATGYWSCRRVWSAGDAVVVSLPMHVQRLYADPRVRQNGYQVAFQRGPLVYCVEEVDNGADLAAIAVSRKQTISTGWRKDILGGVQVLSIPGVRRSPMQELYSNDPPDEKEVVVTAVPYALWAHRGEGEMRVWIAER